MQKILNESNTPEFIGQIIDVIEDKFTELKIKLPTDEKEKALTDATDPADIPVIYGSDYDAISDEIKDVLQNTLGSLTESIADAVMKAIKDNLEDTGRIEPIWDMDKQAIYDKIVQTCMNWGLS